MSQLLMRKELFARRMSLTGLPPDTDINTVNSIANTFTRSQTFSVGINADGDAEGEADVNQSEALGGGSGTQASSNSGPNLVRMHTHSGSVRSNLTDTSTRVDADIASASVARTIGAASDSETDYGAESDFVNE